MATQSTVAVTLEPFFQICGALGEAVELYPEALKQEAVRELSSAFEARKLRENFQTFDDLLTRVQMVVISCVIVRMMELAEQRENFTLDDCIRLTGLWSRQLEYSLENLALLADACFLEPQLQYEPLLTLAASFSF